jgi:hypothetical protein
MLTRDSGFVLVVEGCDRTGKTSLCEYVRDFLQQTIPVLKFSQPKGDAVLEYQQALADHPGSFIADRFHMGESVYGPIYRGTPPVPNSRIAALEGDLDRRGALVVYMTDTEENIRRRFEAHGEDFAKGEHVREILDRYDAEFARCALPKVRLVWSPGSRISMAVAVTQLTGWIEEARS